MEQSRPKPKERDDGGTLPPPPPPLPPPPPELEGDKKGGLFGFLTRKKDKVSATTYILDEQGSVDYDRMEKRIAWEEQENENAERARKFGEEYVRRPVPKEFWDAEYAEQKRLELEIARTDHERSEIARRRQLGDAYVERPFVPPSAAQMEEEHQQAEDAFVPPPPPPRLDDGELAEILGKSAYGESQVQSRGSYISRADVDISSVPLLVSGSANVAPVVPKVGWAGIFDTRRGPPAPNPFKGSIVHPQVSYAASSLPVVQEKGIPPDVAKRLDEARGLATLALNNHESAPALEAKGLKQEALAAYQAADAGYDQALRTLLPLRKALENGPESSRLVRVREAAKLEKLITKLLDRWEEVKPHLIPELPSAPVDTPVEEADPLLDRLSSSMAHLQPRPAVFRENGELNPDALPSIPTHGMPATRQPGGPFSDGESTVPKTGGPKFCYVCTTPSNKKSAELVTPCNHYLCTSCADQMFGLFPDKCPECSESCRKEDLKAIA